jgi:type IV secretory pathway VirB10-like protein
VEGTANVAAAERRDAFARSSRTSRALFFAVVLIVFAALGYYGYEHAARLRGDTATASADGQTANVPSADESPAQAAPPEKAARSGTESGDSTDAPLVPPTKPAEPKPVVAEAVAQPAAAEEPRSAPSTATRGESKRPSNTAAVARTRPASVRPAVKADADPYSRPAAASNASAAATQQTIERYLGIRAGVAPQRSPY